MNKIEKFKKHLKKIMDLRDEENYKFMKDHHMIKCIRNGDNVFKYASTKLKSDIDIVIQASQRHPKALMHASNKLKKNPKNAINIIKACPETYKYFPQDIRSNESFILIAIKQSIKLLDHPKIYALLEDVIKNTGISIFKNKDFLLELIESLPRLSPDLMKKLFMDTRLGSIFFYYQNDKEIMRALVKRSVYFYACASKDLQSEYKFFSYAISKMSHQRYETYTPFQEAPKKFCCSKPLAKRASQIDGRSFKYFDESVRSDEEIATLYYNLSYGGGDVLKHVPQSIKKNPKFINLGIRKNLLQVDSSDQARRLLERGADPMTMFRHCKDFVRMLHDVHVPVLNQRPDLVKHLQNIKTLYCFDYSKLNSAARELLYERYIYLEKKYKKSSKIDEDLFETANKLVKIKDMMCINPIS